MPCRTLDCPVARRVRPGDDGPSRSPLLALFAKGQRNYEIRPRIELLNRQINARTDRINTDLARIGPSRVSVERYDTPVTELVQTTATLNSVRAVDPAAVAASLVKAHDELVKAVNDPKTQYASLVNSLIDFAEQADALRQALASKPTAATTASTPKSE